MLMSSTIARCATRVIKNTLKTTQWNIQARQSGAYSLFKVPACMFSGQNKNFVMKKTELSNELLISLSMGFEHNQATNQAELTKNMIANNVLKSSVVQRAFQELDRGLFAINHKQKVYANNPLSIGKGQNMTSPLMHGLALEEFHEHIVTIMKHKLQKQETLRILDVGCGRGYISFALGKILDQNSHLDKVKVHIKGIDIHEELIQGAKDIKNKLQYHHNIDFEFNTNNIESEINEVKHKYDIIYVGVALDQNVYTHLIEKLYSSKQEGSCVLCPVIQEDLEQNLVLREGSQERVIMKCVFSQMVTQKQEEVSKYFLQDGDVSEEDKGDAAAHKDEENKINVTSTKMHQDLVKFETHLKLLEAKLKRFYEEHKQKHGHNPGLKDLHSNEESKKLIENIQQVKKDIRFTQAKIKESQQ